MILLLILFVSKNYGQDPGFISEHPKTYSISIHAGTDQIREKILLPLVHKGMVTELSFGTEKIKGSLRQFELLIDYSRLKTNLEEMAKSASVRIGLGYAYNFRLLQSKNFMYYLGPKVSLSYSFGVYPNWDESHIYWADCLSFGVNNIFTLPLPKEREWFTSLSIPLLGFFSRPEDIRPFKMDNVTPGGILKAFHSQVESGFIHNLMLINFKTEYRFPVFTHKREAITFQMDVIRMSKKDGNPIFQLITMLGLKIML
jgi:hypothetical protein